MILDYFYSKNNKKLSVSYINEDGNKKILDFNVAKFKTYYYTPKGRYLSWDGAMCDEKYTENPSDFDYKTFFEELNPKYKKLLEGKYLPKMYTFDIETYVMDGVSAGEAAQTGCAPILTISIASPDCNVMVLGTKKLDEEGVEYVSKSFDEYISKLEYFNNLKMKKPYIKYIYFSSEREMLDYFLSKIVAKVPVLAGWNSILFDWQYIVNRVKNYYQDLSIQLSSCSYSVKNNLYSDVFENKITLPMPRHTLIIDMMDIVKKYDYKGIFDKAAFNLDYVAHETIGANKIEYDGELQDLYQSDYKKYIYYNAIDSVLVQLIDKRFKSFEIICLQALYCSLNIEAAFSMIAITESLVFKDFYKNGLKIVYEERNGVERGKLLGAYVKDPTPGKYQYIACNDFASLYPSTIITCNLSFENFIGYYHKEDELNKYRNDTGYIVIGPDVFKNKGTALHPKLGELLSTHVDYEKLKQYEGNPNYFVTVKGSVYKNDKDYSFKRIQKTVKSDRGVSKYLGKELDAKVMLDIEHIEKGIETKNTNYSESVVNCLKGLGYQISCTDDIYKVDLQTLKRELKTEIEWHEGNQLAMKLVGNSMYGGSSHVGFYWFNMSLANDITGESRNLTLLMEEHLSKFWYENWGNMTDWHKKWGIKLKKNWKEILSKCNSVIYSDTDSLYIEYQTLINTIDGSDKLSQKEKLDILLRINLEFLNQHNKEYIDKYYRNRFAKSVHEFELETIAKSGIWLNIKKRYAQILLWKDGKYYDEDDLPMKIKGLEIIQSSTPKFVKKSLKNAVRYLLESDNEYLVQKLNMFIQQEKTKFYEADLESICAGINAKNYNKYIVSDKGDVLQVAPKCPSSVRALGNYNWIRQKYNLSGEGLYGGKIKWYKYKVPGSNNKTDYFGFQAMNYPEWANKYAPICRHTMFQQFILDPFNRIITAIGLPQLEADGNIQMSLF